MLKPNCIELYAVVFFLETPAELASRELLTSTSFTVSSVRLYDQSFARPASEAYVTSNNKLKEKKTTVGL
ncbi:unnamed protein product [Orchesella dallaii]|uniref:Uncharacterized protein n=1 Tax=Orchesella dallaii TaxID=48710 RepID=A0ABP1QXG0_9HEXA